MVAIVHQFNRFSQRVQSVAPYKVAHTDTAPLFQVIWVSFLVAYLIHFVMAGGTNQPVEILAMFLVLLVLLPADTFLPAPSTWLVVRLTYLVVETLLLLCLAHFSGFGIVGYMLFALIGQAAFVLPVQGSFAFTFLTGISYYLALSVPWLNGNHTGGFEFAWVIGAVFTWGAMVAMRTAREQQAEITALNQKLADSNRKLNETNQLVQAQAQLLAQQALEDSLTGLKNRRYLDNDLPREYERARRFNKSFTLAVIDVDFFKTVNDRYTHDIGDKVLIILSHIFRHNCRAEIDSVVRYGGEEFIMYFPETKLQPTGMIIAERIREAVEEYDWNNVTPGLAVTVSIGLSGIEGTTTYQEMINWADRRLYHAKQTGRNRTAW